MALMEGIYYSHVVPRGSAILTLMGLVFDKVHFPGAYFPSAGFDPQKVGEEIVRLEQLPRDFDTAELIGILKFLKHVPTLRGFCEFQPTTVRHLQRPKILPATNYGDVRRDLWAKAQ
jgi:hypothetical protein